MADERETARAAIMALVRHPTTIDRHDLTWLVEVAAQHEEISSGKAAELLGLDLETTMVVLAHWATRRGKP